MRICVCTIVHHPEDARILHRQILALLEAGHEVTYIAPFRARNVTPWRDVTPVDVPRASGRRRIGALRAARREMAKHAAKADLLLIHDPELLLALPRRRPPTVWDVHEDTAAALGTKSWLPRPLRSVLRPAVHAAEWWAQRRVRLLLAEHGYVDRFSGDHPVVPNTTYVPETPGRPPEDDRVVYLGQLSLARGAAELVELGRRLCPYGISVELIGAADADTRPLLRDAQREGAVRWYGFVPNDRALRMLEGATAGLSLLHDVPNYRHSLPTKVIEYMARGVPVITTPNPQAARIVGGAGVVVPYEDGAAAAEAVLRLRDDQPLRSRMATVGHAVARRDFHWPEQASHFVKYLEDWADAPAPSATLP
ncbi:MAG: glycosyltransferase [Streptosporangiales bacterium]|nr:glycosyltransferase [Streptosporangiales bacterium]